MKPITTTIIAICKKMFVSKAELNQARISETMNNFTAESIICMEEYFRAKFHLSFDFIEELVRYPYK
jgi:hypothetical protein